MTAASEFVWRSGFKFGALPFRTSLILRLKKAKLDLRLTMETFDLFEYKIENTYTKYVCVLVCIVYFLRSVIAFKVNDIKE